MKTVSNETLRDKLEDLLPHGSGINYNWNIYQLKSYPNRWYANNWYDAMCGSGIYCHTYNYTAIYEYKNGKFEFIKLNFHGQKEYNCCGFGLKDYLTDILCDIYI